MEYKELDGSIRQGYNNNEIHLNGNYRDWFTGDKFAETQGNSDRPMEEISQPASNQLDVYDYAYDQEHVIRGPVSDSQYNHQKQQQQHYAQLPQTLELGIGGQICNIEREHMFDKVVTPSDVGKLNRLVIPKQHAEKYFPLDSNSSNDDQKGLLLNFEDVMGKTWRFRYSYWSSSQSYVMTKGWSRFVKDKKLDAGDVVSFQRGVGEAEKHRLFIDWRKRPISSVVPFDAYHTDQFYRSDGSGGLPSWSPPVLLFRPPPNYRVLPTINFHNIPNITSSHYNYSGYGGGNYNMGHNQVLTENGSVVYVTSHDIGMLRGRGGVGDRIPLVFESVPVVHGNKVVAAASANNKQLRLFGVNMDCPISSDTSTSLSSSSSTIPVNSSAATYLNQHPSSSTILLCPSSTGMTYNGTPVSNKGKTSMSLDFEL